MSYTEATAEIRLPEGYTLTGGGHSLRPNQEGGIVNVSRPTDDGRGWYAEVNVSSAGLQVYATGVKIIDT
jgi:hypothetical protein